ncbi:hypothetical protein DFH09DRAFT_1069242 [Mycena vulgaris]|nr:hypothetical protein DFH09DRAFT_1069242 [Mycena vulgaris]
MPGDLDTLTPSSGDSAEMPDRRCTQCITFRTECTHDRLKGSENPFTPFFRTAQEHVSSILSTSTVYITPSDPHEVLLAIAQYARGLEEQLSALQPHAPITAPTTLGSPAPFLTAYSTSPGTQGRLLVPDHTGPNGPIQTIPDAIFHGGSSSAQIFSGIINCMDAVSCQRPEFWTAQPWEQNSADAPIQVFPEHDQLSSLIHIYFEQINPLVGLLHSPSFHQSISEGLYLRDRDFGAVVLAVCSLASRYSEDPRVLLDGESAEHSCGWKWFRQVICLCVLFLTGSSESEECWILAGFGIRFAQGAGVHHRRGYIGLGSLEAELYKRAFFTLVVADTLTSCFRGRPRVIWPAVELDLDLPVNCDGEFWGIPNAVQPLGRPSHSAFTIAYLRLMEIFRRIQDIIVCIQPLRLSSFLSLQQYPANGRLCSQSAVGTLDAALNEWVINDIPAHLRWNPAQENPVFLEQSATLVLRRLLSETRELTPVAAQILIHRPFIPAPGQKSIPHTSFPSLAICANAARSCGHILGVETQRRPGLLHHPYIMHALFDCAIVLLADVDGSREPLEAAERYTRAAADVQPCLAVLRLHERRWRMAGKLCDVISAMLEDTSRRLSLNHLQRGKVTPTSDLLKGVLFPESPPVAGSWKAIVR